MIVNPQFCMTQNCLPQRSNGETFYTVQTKETRSVKYRTIARLKLVATYQAWGETERWGLDCCSFLSGE